MADHPTESRTPGADEPLLEARALTVRFGPVAALDGVGFTLAPGEIHALMGENGAGKSTLIKCLTGVLKPNAGEIRLGGRSVRSGSPREAETVGIAAVFQEIGLIPHMTVAQNVCLGREPVRRGWPRLIRWGAVRQRAHEALARLGLAGLDVDRELGACSIAVQQLVAIARALDVNPRVLMLDEPTSSLDRDEVALLLDILRRLRAQGLGIVLITHVLEQVEAIADRVTVLRDGKLVGVRELRGLPRAELVSMMLGRAFDAVPSAAKSVAPKDEAADTVLTARALGRRGMLESVDLSVGRGEAVGLAGLLGSGRTEAARLLFGADRADKGELLVEGRRRRFASPHDAIACGLAMTPENRKTEGIVPSLSVRANIVLALQARRGLAHRIPGVEQERLADRFIRSLGIKARDADAPVAHLSGGNQQKVLLARWLATNPRVLILDEPTRGIDVAAKADILRAVHDLRAGGMAVVFITSELEELVLACGRVVVMRDRRSVASLSGERVTEAQILAAISQEHAPPS